MGCGFIATLVIAGVLFWGFHLNIWLSVIIGVIAGPFVAAGFQALFGRKAAPPAPAAPVDAVDVQFSEAAETQSGEVESVTAIKSEYGEATAPQTEAWEGDASGDVDAAATTIEAEFRDAPGETPAQEMNK